MREIKKSCDMVVVGKAIWKMMHIPAILYGRTVVTTSDTNIIKLQRIENKIWRFLLGVGGYATIEALRGEIGASMVKSRIMETSLAYIIDVMNSEFNELKSMMQDSIKREKGRWFNNINRYRQELKLTWEELLNQDRKSLKKLIKNYDNDCWEKGLLEKPAAKFYATEKKEIGYKHCYRNNYNSKLYARARLNALQLEEHKGRSNKNYDTTYKLCREEKEDLVHFTVKCIKLERKRNNSVINIEINDPEERMKDLLYKNTDYRRTSRVIRDLWILRRHLLKELKEDIPQIKEQKVPKNKQADKPNPPQSGPPQCDLPQSRVPYTA